MDPQTELNLLETAYSNLLTGGVKSYSINGREITRLDFNWIVNRMDTLRAAIVRAQTGIFAVAQNRTPE